MTEKRISCAECFAYKPRSMMRYERSGTDGFSMHKGPPEGWICRFHGEDAHGEKCVDDNGECLFCDFKLGFHMRGCPVRAGEPDKITPGKKCI